MRAPLVGLVTLCLWSACRDSAYTSAQKKDTVSEWRAFLKEHPEDENRPAAVERLAELEFAEAQKAHTVVAYKRFLGEFPESDKAGPAKALLEGLRFNAAEARGTSAGWRQFIAEHPDGAHRAEAEAKLTALELKELPQLNDEQALAAIAAKRVDQPGAEAAADRLDALSWAKAGDARAWFEYLKRFPAGAHRDEARVRLLDAELEGLLVSGQLEQAKQLRRTHPLAGKLPRVAERLTRAERVVALRSERDEVVQQALPAHMLRPLDELVRSLQAPDPLDRAQAAEELGFHVSVEAVGPLLEAFRTARLPMVRDRCVEALGRVLRALPRPVADYQVAVRLEALGAQAGDAQLVLTQAVLLDLSGHLDLAAAEYQRAWDPQLPDPVVLRRWAGLRLERRQFFSAAVAARQLAIGAGAVAREASLENVNPLAPARALCSAADAARYALTVLDAVAKERTEFPEDVVAFQQRGREEARLVEAKLKDAELALLTASPTARRCDDEDPVPKRMAEGEARRLAAVEALRTRKTPQAQLVLEVLRETDPSPRVREAAR